jgi:hypothetical protein
MRKTTWTMTAMELAKVVAGNKGWRGQPSGWIYDDDNQPLVQGWATLAEMLEQAGLIVAGQGVDWILFHRPRVTQAFHAACERHRRGIAPSGLVR